jgi:RES domain-containing protein
LTRLPADILDAIRPWSGVAFVHVEPGGQGDGLDVDSMSRQPNGRWNEPPDPTLYFAGDPAVALSELARHASPDGAPARRALLRVRVELQRVVDVRPRAVAARLGVTGAPHAFLRRDEARRLATRLRSEDVEAVLVPPMAFLDQPERWNLVCFVERLGDGWLGECERVGALEIRPEPG